MTVSLRTRVQTARFVLRAPAPRDVGALAASMKRNEEHLGPWSPAGAFAPLARTAVRVSQDVARAAREWRADRRYTLLVFPKDGPEDWVLGRVALSSVVRGVFQNAYLGYWTDKDALNIGLMSECVHAVVDWSFGALRLHRIQAAVMPRNAASLRVLEKVGFRREGHAEKYLQIAGKWEDHVLCAITREDLSSSPSSLSGTRGQGASLSPARSRGAARPTGGRAPARSDDQKE